PNSTWREIGLTRPAEKPSKAFDHPHQVTTVMVVHKDRAILALPSQVHVIRVPENVLGEAERAWRDLEVVASAVGGMERADVPRVPAPRRMHGERRAKEEIVVVV